LQIGGRRRARGRRHRRELLLILLQESSFAVQAGGGKVFQVRVILMEPRGRPVGGMKLEISVKVLVHQPVVLRIEGGRRWRRGGILGGQVDAHEDRENGKRSEKLKSADW